MENVETMIDYTSTDDGLECYIQRKDGTRTYRHICYLPEKELFKVHDDMGGKYCIEKERFMDGEIGMAMEEGNLFF